MRRLFETSDGGTELREEGLMEESQLFVHLIAGEAASEEEGEGGVKGRRRKETGGGGVSGIIQRLDVGQERRLQ